MDCDLIVGVDFGFVAGGFVVVILGVDCGVDVVVVVETDEGADVVVVGGIGGSSRMSAGGTSITSGSWGMPKKIGQGTYVLLCL